MRLEIELELGPVEPESQLSVLANPPFDLTGFEAKHFIA